MLYENSKSQLSGDVLHIQLRSDDNIRGPCDCYGTGVSSRSIAGMTSQIRP